MIELKRKRYLYSFIALMVVVIGTIVLLLDGKVQIVAATTVFKEQQWQVLVSESLRENSVTKGDVYITRASGDKITVPIEMSDDRRSLTIKGLKVGEYKLHLGEKAFERKSMFAKQQEVAFRVIEKLEKVTSEQELRDYFEAVLAMQQSNSNNWGFSTEESEVSMDKASSSGNERHSTTNNQVEGIEEGDMTVTDGRHIYTMRDNSVIIINVEQQANAKVVHKLTFSQNAYPSQLMLHENYLLVTYDEYIERQTKEGYYDGKSLVKTAIYDVTNAADPKLVREIGQEGGKIGVRKDGNLLYVVTTQSPNYYIMNENPDIDLVPSVYDSTNKDEMTSLPIDRISILPNSTEPSYIIISALDLSNMAQGEMTTESFLGSSSQMYMSENAIYVTAAQYEYVTPMEDGASKRMAMDIAWGGTIKSTQVYKFAIEGANVSLVGQTSVPGQLLNQFSMDEYNNYFRVATTQYENNNRDNSTNSLYIYDATLNEVGKLTDLAKGERIYSARFMGDKAYIVTFKEVDPLFVIDVANPAAPKVLGELKIPGFSNYLHPISETHLLGIGYDTVVKTDQYTKEPFVETKGMKVALFDVSDLANPKEQDAVIIGGRGTYSEIQHNHKALFRDVENNLYGFPITMYEEGGEYEVKFLGYGAQIYKVTVEDGIQLAGDLVNYDVEDMQYEDWEKVVQRIMYVGDTVYTVARGELQSYRLPNFEPLQHLPY